MASFPRARNLSFAAKARPAGKYRPPQPACAVGTSTGAPAAAAQAEDGIALSRPSPTVPNDGRSPAERILSPKTHEVNW
ncbi:hypothetical protein ACFVW1_42055, partial [Streptomyces olivochromogenes]|uniref:hypothetical protein n=1 Tax=Streptomyces olivochromogenes TaxID=1963 RepID=UPI0036D76ABC